jgi:hypothetical protein
MMDGELVVYVDTKYYTAGLFLAKHCSMLAWWDHPLNGMLQFGWQAQQTARAAAAAAGGTA